MSHTHPNDMMTCPYNPSHQVERYRMQYHLEKCRKQHPNSKKVDCPFDATHIVSEVELDHHVTVCPHRNMFDRVRYVIDDTSEFVSSAPPAPVIASEENWDDDNFSTYDPSKQTANNASIIKKIKGATPSERRQARMEGMRTYKPPTGN